MKEYIKGKLKLAEEILTSRIGIRKDFVGYETHLELIRGLKNFEKLKGDALEIGAFMGGGTKKLALFFKDYGKVVHVIDKFDIYSDSTVNDRGESMRSIYSHILGKRDLFEEFQKNTKGCDNIVVHKEDSKKVRFGKDLKLCFSFIDGCHEPSYVYSDFLLAWNHTVGGGVVSFHDYKRDIGGVTQTIDKILREYKDEIQTTYEVSKKNILYIIKK